MILFSCGPHLGNWLTGMIFYNKRIQTYLMYIQNLQNKILYLYVWLYFMEVAK